MKITVEATEHTKHLIEILKENDIQFRILSTKDIVIEAPIYWITKCLNEYQDRIEFL